MSHLLRSPEPSRATTACTSGGRLHRTRQASRGHQCRRSRRGDQALQRPRRRPARQLRPRRSRSGGVLAPHVPASGAPVAAHRDLQHRRTPPERLMRRPPDDPVTRRALAPALPAPSVGLKHPTRQDRTTWLKTLPNHLQAERVQPGSVIRSGAAKGSVTHVEVIPMSGVGTLILERPRPLPSHRRADHTHLPIYPPSGYKARGIGQSSRSDIQNFSGRSTSMSVTNKIMA